MDREQPHRQTAEEGSPTEGDEVQDSRLTVAGAPLNCPPASPHRNDSGAFPPLGATRTSPEHRGRISVRLARVSQNGTNRYARTERAETYCFSERNRENA